MGKITTDKHAESDSIKMDAMSASDLELQKLEQGYIQAKARLSALERKGAATIAKYGEERLLRDPAWHKEHYDAVEAVRSAKLWLDAYKKETLATADIP